MSSSAILRESKFRTLMNMMLSPGTALKAAISGMPLYFSMLVSSLAFGLFFLQTGIDLYRTGQQSILFVVAISIIGAVFGVTIVPLIGVICWAIAKPFGSQKSLKWALSAFCLSYSGALVYSTFGLVTALTLGWRTSVAFGVTGVLWAIGPMTTTIREMVGGKIILSIILASMSGTIVLFCWSFIGKF